MLTLLIFITILSILILVHEFGHFIVAKKQGVRVEEFGLGLPPRVIGKRVGETIYSFNLLPFGGFVKLTGEDASGDEANVDDPKNFITKTPFQRFTILVAGVLMNLFLAVIVYYAFLFLNDFKTLNLPLLFDHKFAFGDVEITRTVVTNFADKSPLPNQGVTLGEALVEIDGAPIYNIEDVRRILADKADKETRLVFVDMKANTYSPHTVAAVPYKDENGNVVLGVYLGDSVSISYQKPEQMLFSGFLHSYNMFTYTMDVLGELISTSFESRSIQPVSEGVSGPVGIYTVIGGIIDYGGPKAYLGILDFLALMSLSLAFLNILPFPALDGGRVMFVVYEMARGKKVKPSVEIAIHKWGMVILLMLIVLVTIKDITRIFFL